MSKLPWIDSISIKTVTLKQGRYGLLVFGTHSHILGQSAIWWKA